MKKDIKKEVEKYMKLSYTRKLIKEDDGTYYIAIEELPGCASVGDTAEEAMEMIEDAMRGWIESNIERGLEIPLPDVWKLLKDFVVKMPPKKRYKIQAVVKSIKRGEPTSFDAKKEKMRKRIKKMNKFHSRGE